ncbi:hypothetical protein BVC71_06535 [Marivivens niveibacter]|uniref:DUF3833 domain-containing protein n=1 Tax=Marivivens niveibacter TaxID=1930667 RepID=A0A251X000_9RHOB|nr:DUF3833 family protein [Marivivens niveibacter]OUD09503.1 hypothetical protein BVC71_06535 [Marivivens niveibacter]
MTFLYGILCGILIVAAALWVFSRFAGFRAQKISDYKSADRPIDIRKEFNGHLVCEGVIYGPLGRVTSRFVADMHAEWDGNRGVMKEYFTYASGENQAREWTFTVDDDGRIKADAPDLVGTGNGQQSGSAVVLNYNIKLTENAGGHVLSVTDWMYAAPNGVLVNRSQFRKFGIKVAELVATMRPAEERKCETGTASAIG